jgi:hypothetical protein
MSIGLGGPAEDATAGQTSPWSILDTTSILWTTAQLIKDVLQTWMVNAIQDVFKSGD